MMRYRHHHFKAPMCSTVLHIVTVLILIGSTLQSTTEKIETIGEEVEADVKELKQDLEHAESKDPQKLEIYKQIRRLNPDGSYTVGYESDDGSFKIESRDVQGNVKGTYGYVDANGEIKRVSYIASNSTGNKKQNDDPQTVSTVKPSRAQYITSTTKRPYLSQSSTNSPNRQSVIQTIPRKRLVGQFSLDKLTQSSTTATTPVAQQSNSFYVTSKYPEIPVTDSTTTVIYATSAPTSKPTIVVHPTPILNGAGRNLDQISRPDRQDSSDSSRKVQIVNARESSTVKPVVEIENLKENEKVSIRGNNYRRQLPNEKLYERESEATTATQHQIIYSHVDDGEGSSVYGGSQSAKPLYTSTSTSRIPAIVIAARQRANHIQQAINNGQTTVATTVRTPPENNYAKLQRNQDTTKTSAEQSTESTSEQNFLTQTSRPIVQIPPNHSGQQTDNEEPIIYRRRPIPPQNFQQYPIREHIRGVNPNAVRNIGREPQVNINDRSEQFLRETNVPQPQDGVDAGPQHFSNENLIIPPNLPPFRGQRKPYDQRSYTAQQEQDSEYDQQYFPNPGYNRFSSGYGNDIINRPLTALDFERLLHYLVLRHQQLQNSARFGYYPQSNGYRPISNFGQYSPYQQIPRPPIIDPGFYDPRNPYYRPSNQVRQYNEPESTYQAQNQIPEQAGQYQRRKPSNYYPTRYFTDTTGSYTKNEEQYDEAQSNSADDSDIPSNIREELLYRMLMLAIRGESQNLIPNQNKDLNPIALSGAAGRGQYTKKPVRSVQILSED